MERHITCWNEVIKENHLLHYFIFVIRDFFFTKISSFNLNLWFLCSILNKNKNCKRYKLFSPSRLIITLNSLPREKNGLFLIYKILIDFKKTIKQFRHKIVHVQSAFPSTTPPSSPRLLWLKSRVFSTDFYKKDNYIH